MNISKAAIMVTGATGGIGNAIIRDLYAHGEPTIVAACRNTQRLTPIIDALKAEFPTSPTIVIPHSLDLASFADVRRSATALVNSGIRLRALINNAGTMPLLHHTTIDGHEQALQVNYLSTLLLTELLLPALDNSATVVFTTSVTRHLSSPSDDFDTRSLNAHGRWAHFINYARSKNLLTHYALHLSRELADRHINVCCSDPGVVNSGIITLGIPLVDRASDLLFRPLISSTEQGAEPAIKAVMHPQNGAVFTRRRIRQIPQKWLSNHNHQAAILHTKRILSALKDYPEDI